MPSADPSATTADPISGSDTTNSLPRPTPSLVADTRPPCSSTRRCTSVSPSPRPPRERASGASARMNNSKTCRNISGAMPIPVSRTRITPSPPSRATVISTRPPAGVYLSALSSRLNTICSRRVPSPFLDRLGLDRERDVVLLHAGIAAQGEERLARDLIQVDAAGIELGPHGEHARDVEQVVDQVRQMAHLTLDDGALAGGLLGRGAGGSDH